MKITIDLSAEQLTALRLARSLACVTSDSVEEDSAELAVAVMALDEIQSAALARLVKEVTPARARMLRRIRSKGTVRGHDKPAWEWAARHGLFGSWESVLVGPRSRPRWRLNAALGYRGEDVLEAYSRPEP